MEDRDSLVIYCGRFQPFHNGHLASLGEIIQRTEADILVGVILNTLTSGTPSGTYAQRMSDLGDASQTTDKNPLSAVARLKAVCSVISRLEGPGRITVTAIPRPERHWELIEAMSGRARRTWALPAPGDEFDQAKARFYESMGDEILWLEGGRTLSGTEVRELFSNSEDITHLVPPEVLEVLGRT